MPIASMGLLLALSTPAALDGGLLARYGLLSLASCLVWAAVYRLVLSPVAKFPGPRLAALTGAYEAYYECVKDGGGRFRLEIDRMHDKYGTV